MLAHTDLTSASLLRNFRLCWQACVHCAAMWLPLSSVDQFFSFQDQGEVWPVNPWQPSVTPRSAILHWLHTTAR